MTDINGKVVERLFLMRNPWGNEMYIGKWYDGDARWSSGVGVDYLAASKIQILRMSDLLNASFFLITNN